MLRRCSVSVCLYLNLWVFGLQVAKYRQPVVVWYSYLHCRHLVYHRRAVAQPRVKGDRLSKVRMAKFDPTQIQNPSTGRHKIWNKSLRPRGGRAKFRANPCKSCFSANGWNIRKIFLWYIYLSLLTDLQVLPPADFHARWLGQRGLTQGSNIFGNRNSKLISNSWKIPPKSKIWPQNAPV